jgi:ubiquinone biosynthesis monooxygenase Coq7
MYPASAVAQFRADELEHRDSARDAGAAKAFGYPVLTGAVRAACRLAIGFSKRI